jgi:hypothetical protein
MLGFADNFTAWGYILSILAAILCVIYGLITWNKGTEIEEDYRRIVEWEREEIEVEERLP